MCSVNQIKYVYLQINYFDYNYNNDVTSSLAIVINVLLNKLRNLRGAHLVDTVTVY